MPIPPLNQDGLLPVGVHECTLAEMKTQFGVFQRSDRRSRLVAQLETFLSEAARTGLVVSVLVDGSFVTATPEPNDIDLIVIVSASYDFAAEITMAAYNVLSKQRVRRRFGFDLLLAREGSPEARRWVEFFQQVRLAPGKQKGILKVRL
jgi:hypothetical protein